MSNNKSFFGKHIMKVPEPTTLGQKSTVASRLAKCNVPINISIIYIIYLDYCLHHSYL